MGREPNFPPCFGAYYVLSVQVRRNYINDDLDVRHFTKLSLMSTTTHKKTVVIVGGGLVGAAIAKDLSGTLDASQHRLVMITASPKLVHYPALVRTVTTAEGKLEDRVFMSYDKLMKGSVGEVKVGEVVSFTTDNVSLASGETVNYDVLVLTPGNKWAGPLSLPTAPKNLQDHLDSWRGKIEKAKDIVLVGGGAVGVGECF